MWDLTYSRRRSFVATCLCIYSLVFILGSCNSAGSSSASSAVTPSPTTLSTPLSSMKAVTLGQNDWPTYHHDMLRAGYLPTMLDPKHLSQAWNTPLDGAVYAEPLVIQGHLLVVTENDTLYSLNVQTGSVEWHTNVGSPVSRSTLPCGDIDPLGITSTPVYDPQTNLLFAVAEIQGPSHVLVGVDVNTGQVRVRRTIDLPGMDPTTHQQRSALALYQNRVYVAFGGLAGDCGQYIGTIVASQTTGQGPLLSYRVPTPREGAIWAPSGPAIDSVGHVFVAVGNGAITQGTWDHSDSILRLFADLRLEDGFAPTQWGQDNNNDADLGSMGPLLLPHNLLFAAGKSGFGYLLHADNLGGVGGQITDKPVCPGSLSMGGAALLGSQVYIPCLDGVQEMTVSGTQMNLGWKDRQLTLPPVIGGHTVYGLDNNGTLYAVDATTGQLRAQISLNAPVAHFATPTLSANHIFFGTMNSVYSIAAS